MAVECYESRDIVRRLGGLSHHCYNLSYVTLGKICPFCGYRYVIGKMSAPGLIFLLRFIIHSTNIC